MQNRPRPRIGALASVLAGMLVFGPVHANAQEDQGSQAQAASTVAPAPEPSTTTPPAEPLWTLAASAGVSSRDDGPDGSWQTLALTRRLGRGYVRGSMMRYNGTLQQSDAALPSDYYVGTLGAGGNFDNWVVDGWMSYGRQRYGKISTASGSRSSTGAKGSDYYAVGGDFGRVVPLGSRFYLTPTVAASFASGKLLRPAPTGSDQIDLETDEPTWSGNATMRMDYAFGAARSHYIGLSISRNWSSNGVSALRVRPSGDGDGTPAFALDSKHYADGWSEIGTSANMKLGRNLYLDLFATRSFGALAGNVTAAGVGLRKSF